MKAKFCVGCCKKIITPPLGTPLYGYPDYENRKAKSVHDDLYANAAVFGAEVPEAVLVSLDLCTMQAALADRIRAAVGEKAGIPAEQVIICLIHTHSGPCTAVSGICNPATDPYINETLIPAILKAVGEAAADMHPAKLGIGTTQSLVGINRRQILADGRTVLGQNPYGCFDPEMTVLAFVGEDDKPLLNIIHYGAHATASGKVPAITRDWPGYMVDRMEALTGAMSFFINGAEGDVGPRLSSGRTTGDLTHAAEIGGAAAVDAMRAYRAIRGYRAVHFRTVTGQVTLPYRPFPRREEITAEMAEMESKSMAGLDLRKYQVLKQRLAVLDSEGEIPESRTFGQVLFAFNEAVLVPFPFEMFSEITVRLRQYSPFGHTLGLSNANGTLAYLPSKEQISRGGYEVRKFTESHIFSMAENTDDVIIGENLRLIEALYAKES